MAEPTLIQGQRVVYTRRDSGTRVAIVLRQKANGLADLRVLADALTPGENDVSVRAVAYDSEGGAHSYAFGAEGASEIPITDEGELFSADTVEDALAEVVTAATKLVKHTATIAYSDLSDAVSGEAEAVNVGAALPANAVILGHEVVLTTQFSGGSASAVKLDLGVSGEVGAIVSQFNVLSNTAGGRKYSPGYEHLTSHGIHCTGAFSSAQLIATFTPTADSLSHLTAGALTINVWYVVLA